MGKRKAILFFIVVFLLVDGFLLARTFSKTPDNANYSELDELRGNKLSFKELSNYFTALGEDKGAAYAYEVLKRADIRPGIDMHLMGHIVGDILYKQEGAKGIAVCTPDFRNACSHSIVVGMLLEYGEGALPEIAQTCREAPGGAGAYTMCFHGLGHGILAYAGYDLEKAVGLCETTGTEEKNQREYVECVGGTIMEIIGGGFHNPELWEKQSKKYLSAEDPLSPCNRDFMPELVRPQCYVYLTPHLFEAAGASLANPTLESFEIAFPFCEKIPASDRASRATCYGGFGKEFVVLARARDIRDVSLMTNEEMKQVYDWCLLARNDRGITQCVSSAAASLYWGGENNPETVIRFCNVVEDSGYRNACFSDTINAVGFYVKDVNYRRSFCEELPQDMKENCRKRLL